MDGPRSVDRHRGSLMLVHSKSNEGALLLDGTPPGYPLGHPVDGQEHIPCLARVARLGVPEALCAFNDLGRVADPVLTGLHFFRDDADLLPIIKRPLDYLARFADFRVLLTPDITIGDGMPPWQRARAVVMSRMAGVVWQTHGLAVVPTLRWRNKHDYANVAAGIEQGSVVAVANYGSRRDAELKWEFARGLAEMVERLNPACIMVYGRVHGRPFKELAKRTEFVEYKSPIEASRPTRSPVAIPGQPTIF